MRPARAQINLAALRHNLELIKQHTKSKILAVVKADAYGHGAVPCAQAMAGSVSGFAVSCVEEALELRSSGMIEPLVLLEGIFHQDELEQCATHNLWPVLHSLWQVELLEQSKLSQPLNCWLKVDTGMHRLGFFPQQINSIKQRLLASSSVAQVPVLVSHLACADELTSQQTLNQAELFNQLCSQADWQSSLSNSAAITGWPQLVNHWARPGLMLYGVNPMLEPHQLSQQLQPVMAVQSEVIAIRDLPAGERVGYGGRFVTTKPSRIATVAMGYADGYPRLAEDGTPVMVDGQLAYLAGRVSMDMLTIDVSHLPKVTIGSKVELWGASLSADQVAVKAGTIAYTLLTGIKRIPRNYQH